MCDKGGTTVAGYGSVPGSVANAPELPPPGEVVERAGEVTRKNYQAPP